MAQIVLGIGTSHSPQLSTPIDRWPENADRFKRPGFELYSIPDGNPTTFDALCATAPSDIGKQITVDVFERRYAECQRNLAWLGEVIEAAKLDVLVMFGDDQRELFQDDLMPSVGVYWGADIPVIRGQRLSASDAYSWPEPHHFAGASGLGAHVIQHMCDNDIDAGQSSQVAEGRSISHPFAFVYRRILDGKAVPAIPIWLNTYYPPNQPSPKRCYEVGRAVRAAVETWPGKERVGIVGSGGLSHFVIDEELDDIVLTAMKTRDTKTIFNLPRKRMQAGTSETMLWLAAAGAVEHLEMTETRYVPCYRTAAGTGCAMGFARWN